MLYVIDKVTGKFPSEDLIKKICHRYHVEYKNFNGLVFSKDGDLIILNKYDGSRRYVDIDRFNLKILTDEDIDINLEVLESLEARLGRKISPCLLCKHRYVPDTTPIYNPWLKSLPTKEYEDTCIKRNNKYISDIEYTHHYFTETPCKYFEVEWDLIKGI